MRCRCSINQDDGKGGLSLRGLAFMMVSAVLTVLAVLESTLSSPSACPLQKETERRPWRFRRLWRCRSWRLPPLNLTPLCRHPEVRSRATTTLSKCVQIALLRLQDIWLPKILISGVLIPAGLLLCTDSQYKASRYRETISAIPPYCALWGSWCLNMANWVRYPLPLFWAFPRWRAYKVEVRYPPLKRDISAILARYPLKTRQMGAIPPLRYYLEKVLRVGGGVYRTGPLRADPWKSSRKESLCFFGVLSAFSKDSVWMWVGSVRTET